MLHMFQTGRAHSISQQALKGPIVCGIWTGSVSDSDRQKYFTLVLKYTRQWAPQALSSSPLHRHMKMS